MKIFVKNAYKALHRLGEQHGNPRVFNNPWLDGGANKVLLHSVIAEITAQLAGNMPGSGAIAGGVNEAAINRIIDSVGRDHPDQAQMFSAILGGVVNKTLGKSADAGMAMDQYGAKWNEENFSIFRKDSLEEAIREIDSQANQELVSSTYNDQEWLDKYGFLGEIEKLSDRFLSILNEGGGEFYVAAAMYRASLSG